MGIQQNVNQLLGSATIATGLWAHSPGGKKYLETKQLKREIEQRQAAFDEMDEGPDGSSVQEAKNLFYERTRQLEEKLGQIAPLTKSLSGSGETAAQREISISEERSEEAEDEAMARKKAEKKDIQNIRHQEFLNKILSGTPSEYLLNNQGGK